MTWFGREGNECMPSWKEEKPIAEIIFAIRVRRRPENTPETEERDTENETTIAIYT